MRHSVDPLPTWVVKVFSAEMSIIIAKLVNASLNSATLPSSMKHTVVRHTVKKPVLTLQANIVRSFVLFGQDSCQAGAQPTQNSSA